MVCSNLMFLNNSHIRYNIIYQMFFIALLFTSAVPVQNVGNSNDVCATDDEDYYFCAQ